MRRSGINKNMRIMSVPEFERFMRGKTVYSTTGAGVLEDWRQPIITRRKVRGRRARKIVDIYFPYRGFLMPSTVKFHGHYYRRSASGKGWWEMRHWAVSFVANDKRQSGPKDFSKGGLFYVTTVPARA